MKKCIRCISENDLLENLSDKSIDVKKSWLEYANKYDLLNQYYHTVLRLTSSNIEDRIEAQEDLELAEAEILKRMR